MKKLKIYFLTVALVAQAAWFSSSIAGEQPRSGKVEYSDGKVVAGKISLSPGSELKIHVGNQIKVLPLDRVSAIEMSPEKESMEQNYRFKEAGVAIKETQGDPYPVRMLATKIILSAGDTITGHLYTTVLYVDDGDNATKVLLLAKQRGKEGETFTNLAYPAKITFDDPARNVPSEIRVRIKLPGVGPDAKIGALDRGALVQLEVKSAGAGQYVISSPSGKDAFLAIEAGRKIYVGWPRNSDAALTKLIRNAMTNSEDFFDQRALLGTFRDGDTADLYSLVMASRTGKTTLDEKRSQPWRLEIYRWKQEEGAERVMLAGQGYFFRGIEEVGGPAPLVELNERLWKPKKTGNLWTVGDE